MQPLSSALAGFLLAALMCFPAMLLAQDAPSRQIATPAGPTTEIEFEELEYDFGTIIEGEKVSQVFTFTNTGDTPLILVDAKGSCGCTVPQWPREPIMPGETASITVEFNSKGKKGKRRQMVTITANTQPPQTFLALTGEVDPRSDDDLAGDPLPATETETKLSPDCFAIFPNPTSEILKLDIEASNFGKTAQIAIFSKTGQVMAKRRIEALDGTVEFNVGHYPAGTTLSKSPPQRH